MRDEVVLLRLALILIPLSLTAVGGAASIYAPLQHQTVDVNAWLTPHDFLDLFAVSRLMPGPGSFLATLIGWKVAGWLGAVVATLSIFIPSCALCLAVTGVWNNRLKPRWRTAIEGGLAPIGAGLMFAGVLTLMRLGNSGPLVWCLLVASAAIMIARPRLHPFVLIAVGAVIALLWSWR